MTNFFAVFQLRTVSSEAGYEQDNNPNSTNTRASSSIHRALFIIRILDGHPEVCTMHFFAISPE